MPGTPIPVIPTGRGRDVRNAIRDALLATDAFSSVFMTSPDEYTIPSSDATAAAVEPASGTQQPLYDGGESTKTRVDERCRVTLLARDGDPQTRDELAERLLQAAKNAIDGVSLGGFTVPDRTYVSDWRFQPAKAPERRVVATVTYWYLVDGWNDNADTP